VDDQLVSLLGRGWGFPPQFDSRGRVRMVSDLEDIAESLRILLATLPGERVMQPAYGCELRKLVFDIMNESMATDIIDSVTRAVRMFEPRIVLDDVAVDTTDWFDGLLRLTLHYTIITTNTRHNLVFPFYLIEGTSIGFRP
jgi:phage baseplate assembly protein W